MEWWICGILLAALAALAFAYKRLKDKYQQTFAEVVQVRHELSETRHELAEVNARRKKLLAASTQALIIVEKDFTVSSANKVARRLFGKPPKNTTLMTWTRQHQLHELVEQILQGEKMPPAFLVWNKRYLEAHARPIKDSEKHAVAVALAVQDVTELQQLSRARRDFVTNISHELRTPLASLQLLTETLINGAIDDHEMALNLLQKIAHQIDTLKQIAREVLDLSMLESGKAPIRMSTHSLQAIAQEQIDGMLLQANRKKLNLNIDIDDDITVLVDETMISRVLTNLIHNAIKFTEKGEIKVAAEKANGETPIKNRSFEGEWIKVSVSDTGKGIPPDELTRIFERFYKTDVSRNRQDSGTGLGLAIARHIIDAHGGNIWAESQYGSGATFHFTLPTEVKI